jgi:dsRNA-specific ribonuclease
MSHPSIKLEEAKRAIAFPGFHSDSLLEIALTDPCTLNEMTLPRAEQDRIKRKYRTLAFMGDALIDAILADYLYSTGREFEREELDKYRQVIADRPSLANFAIKLGLPDFSSSWNRKNRKPPEAEPGTWGEMFEAVVGVLFLDADRNFDQVAQWLCDRFLRDAVAAHECKDDDADDELDDDDDSTLVTSEDYAEMLGLSQSDGISFT